MTSLIRRATRGDAVAVDELLAANLPRLHAYVRAKAGPHILRRESSSDLVQSVCREALEELDRFEFRGEAEFRWWLCRIALRKIVDRARAMQADKRDVERERPADAAASADGDRASALAFLTELTPSREAIGRERMAQVETAFGALTDEQREAILLRRIVGLDYDEIARAMDRNEAAVRNLVYRGIARLTTLLGDDT